MERLRNSRVFLGKYSKQVQEKLFELGLQYVSSGKTFNDKAPFLYFDDSGSITVGTDLTYFNNHYYKEVTPEYILSLKVEKKPEFKDLKQINGYYVDAESGIVKVTKQYAGELTKNTFPTEEEAKACLALSQLCQWRDKYNEGWKPDWIDYDSSKYIIEYNEDKIEIDAYESVQRVLAFKSAEIRDKFLEDFRDLIEQAKPLL